GPNLHHSHSTASKGSSYIKLPSAFVAHPEFWNQHDQIEVMYAQETPTRTLLAASTYTRSKTDAGMPTSGHWHTTVRLEVAAVGDLVVTASPHEQGPSPEICRPPPTRPDAHTHTRPPNTDRVHDEASIKAALLRNGVTDARQPAALLLHSLRI